MRCPAACLVGKVSNDKPISLSTMRAGISISVAWEAASTEHPTDAVGRYASSLALPLFDEPQAISLAVEHGLCSHLTSLVLVDEEGRALDGLPEMRKVPLAATHMADRRSAHEILADSISNHSPELISAPSKNRFRQRRESDGRAWLCQLRDQRPAWEIDWDRLANTLLAGDLSGLTKTQRQALHGLARSKPIVDLATAMNVDPISIAVALLAETTQNRMPQRLGRRTRKTPRQRILPLQGRVQDRSSVARGARSGGQRSFGSPYPSDRGHPDLGYGDCAQSVTLSAKTGRAPGAVRL